MTPEQILEKHLSESDINFLFHEANEMYHQIIAAMEEYAKQPPQDKYPDITFAYSKEKLSTVQNHKYTCSAPDGVHAGGYCYARNAQGEYVRPCELGVSLNDINNNANIKG